MLELIKKEIAESSKISFECFYQQYVMNIQDSIVEHDAQAISLTFKKHDDILDVIKAVNEITKELK